MELHSSNLNIQNHPSSLAVVDSGRELRSVAHLSAQQFASQALQIDTAPSKLSTVESTAVVSQIAAGPEAAVAVYGKVKADSAPLAVASDSGQKSADVEVRSSKLSADIELEQAELKVVQQLAAQDREVKAHEQTHSAVGGKYAGAPSFDFTSGPDGRLYATSGKVSIDTSAVENDPRATLEKAQVIIRAALSVSDPSPADRQIAAEAKSLALQALSELREGDSAETGDIAIRENGLKVEQQQLERQEYLAEQELKQAKQDRNQALAESRKQSNDNSLEVLKEYNTQINEIQETLRRLNTQLVDSGAFGKVFPEGFLIDQNV
ncbi:MAG: hypothetical protein OFPII_25100 [Osedax symbiont Rs1]|nr:MAG: hypothetical protein OFPII_25100 [Osedax symbiont Rs1]